MIKVGYEPPPGACYLPELDPLNQARAYTRVTHEGSSCIMEPTEAQALVANASIDDECKYVLTEVRMTPNQFERLPDFAGW
jgi:hypothetical protein